MFSANRGVILAIILFIACSIVWSCQDSERKILREHKELGKATIRGIACQSKIGAFVQDEQDRHVYIEGLHSWPSKILGDTVVATGVLEWGVYATEVREGNLPSQGIGITGPDGTEYLGVARFLLKDAKWELAKE